MPGIVDRTALERGLNDAVTAAERGFGEAAAVARRAIEDCLRLLGDLRKEAAGMSESVATLAKETRRPPIKKLSGEDISARLAGFERAYTASTGERLSSTDFYARFSTGEFDDRFGARWATFYEASQLAAELKTSISAPA